MFMQIVVLYFTNILHSRIFIEGCGRLKRYILSRLLSKQGIKRQPTILTKARLVRPKRAKTGLENG